MNTEKIVRKHSKLGLTSLIISIVLNIFFILWSNNYIKNLTENDYFFPIFVFTCLVALVLGIAGLIQKDKKKLFGILGIVLSTIPILILIFMLYVFIYGAG